MARGLDEPALAAQLNERVHERLAPLFAALSACFLFFSGVTLVVQPAGATAALAAVDLVGALAMGIAAARVRGRDPIPHANGVAAAAFLFTTGASLFAIALLDLPAQTTNVMLVQLVASVILLSARWNMLIVAAGAIGWAALAATHGWTEAWLNAGFALVVSSIMSLTIQWVRVREARSSAELLAANRETTTRLAAAAQAERAHVRALTDANASLEAFSYVVSHDLKEPVRGMRIYLEDLRDNIDAADRRDLIERALASHENLQRLMNGLLEWSRVATATPELEPIGVRALLDDPTTRSVFERVLQERRATLLLAQGLPTVMASAPLLRQVLGNLILNAAKHNDRPDLQIRVYAAPDAPRGMVDLIVEDNGVGFPPPVLERLRDPDTRRSSLKSGFGIAIARRAAERMGGRLELRDREGPEGASLGAQAHVLLHAHTPSHPSKSALAKRVEGLV